MTDQVFLQAIKVIDINSGLPTEIQTKNIMELEWE